MKKVLLATILTAVASGAMAWNAGMPDDSYKPHRKTIKEGHKKFFKGLGDWLKKEFKW